MSGITLDYETADKITLLTLKEALNDVNSFIKKIEEKGNPEYLSQDYVYHTQLQIHLQGVINYYGGYD
jgi:hypothetical protein